MLWLPLVASPSSSSRPQACQAAVRSIVLPYPHASVRAASGNPVQAVSPVVPAAARRQSRSRPHQLSWSSSSLQVAALVNGICHCRSPWPLRRSWSITSPAPHWSWSVISPAPHRS
uniref:Uncharacterized protein n=1 Tax=Oryza meridionalis TaxID=40149 RepID=A0A0E0DKM9_9ORYZ